MVLDDERVRELRADRSPALRRFPLEPPHHRDRLVEADVAVEGWGVDAQLVVAERAAEELVDPLVAEDRRVHLHDDVRVVLLEEMERDLLDLVGAGSRGTSRA